MLVAPCQPRCRAGPRTTQMSGCGKLGVMMRCDQGIKQTAFHDRARCRDLNVRCLQRSLSGIGRRQTKLLVLELEDFAVEPILSRYPPPAGRVIEHAVTEIEFDRQFPVFDIRRLPVTDQQIEFTDCLALQFDLQTVGQQLPTWMGAQPMLPQRFEPAAESMGKQTWLR